jgi:DNA invertase Pin-like site-specific DNA recombinase
MSDSNSNGKCLRFGSLIRVSTEKQEQQGESLRAQRRQIERDVKRLGGRIVDWYGGQEHATPGSEKAEVDRLLADAAQGKFDAVIVAYADRWSRDNAKSKEGLETLRNAGIKFYLSTTEMDLFNPNARFMLGMQAEVGEFFALQQTKKSIECRIEKAKRGVPTGGRLPFGRTFDRKTEQWGIDQNKQKLAVEIAERYLAGEGLPALAEVYGMNRGNLREILRDQSGDKWQLSFRCKSLNIDETVQITVPELLPEATIRAIRQRLEANRTYLHGKPKHDYLLGGRVFCAVCGRNLTGQVAGGQAGGQKGYRYYRHGSDSSRKCPLRPRPLVPADRLEMQVVKRLFNTLGNPAAIARAVKAAVPDCDEAVQRRQRLESDLTAILKARDRILGLVAKDAITVEQAEPQLHSLKDREAVLRAELEKLDEMLADVPDESAIRCYIERIKCTPDPDSICVYDNEGNEYAGGNDVMSFLLMSNADKCELIEAVFDNLPVDGKPAGVYVSPDGVTAANRPKNWPFKIRGRLDFELVLQAAGH